MSNILLNQIVLLVPFKQVAKVLSPKAANCKDYDRHFCLQWGKRLDGYKTQSCHLISSFFFALRIKMKWIMLKVGDLGCLMIGWFCSVCMSTGYQWKPSHLIKRPSRSKSGIYHIVAKECRQLKCWGRRLVVSFNMVTGPPKKVIVKGDFYVSVHGRCHKTLASRFNHQNCNRCEKLDRFEI